MLHHINIFVRKSMKPTHLYKISQGASCSRLVIYNCVHVYYISKINLFLENEFNSGDLYIIFILSIPMLTFMNSLSKRIDPREPLG